MTTARVIYEQYKVLPNKIKQELKALINEDDTVEVSIKGVEQGLKEVKQIIGGQLPRRTFDEFKQSMKNGK